MPKLTKKKLLMQPDIEPYRRRKGMVVAEKPKPGKNIEWVGKSEGDKIRFGLVEGFDKNNALKFSKKMVIRNHHLSKIKHPRIKITVLIEWDKL